MIGRTKTIIAAAVMLTAGAAVAAEVAPADVQYGDEGVTASLTGVPGDPAEGRKAMADRRLGNCLACHAVTEMSEHLFHGDVGPSLDGVADRWDEAQLRSIVANAKVTFTQETVMPGFYSLEVGVNPAKDRAGQTILTAQQVEDIVAYLATLKE